MVLSVNGVKQNNQIDRVYFCVVLNWMLNDGTVFEARRMATRSIDATRCCLLEMFDCTIVKHYEV